MKAKTKPGKVKKPKGRNRKRSRVAMKGPPTILAHHELQGLCDLCEVDMPPSGGLINALAMSILVERGFDPISLNRVALAVLNDSPQSRSDVAELARAGYLQGALGDFALCPRCFVKVRAFATGKSRPSSQSV